MCGTPDGEKITGIQVQVAQSDGTAYSDISMLNSIGFTNVDAATCPTCCDTLNIYPHDLVSTIDVWYDEINGVRSIDIHTEFGEEIVKGTASGEHLAYSFSDEDTQFVGLHGYEDVQQIRSVSLITASSDVCHSHNEDKIRIIVPEPII